MLISLFLTPFDHFHFHPTLGLDPALMLTLRLNFNFCSNCFFSPSLATCPNVHETAGSEGALAVDSEASSSRADLPRHCVILKEGKPERERESQGFEKIMTVTALKRRLLSRRLRISQDFLLFVRNKINLINKS